MNGIAVGWSVTTDCIGCGCDQPDGRCGRRGQVTDHFFHFVIFYFSFVINWFSRSLPQGTQKDAEPKTTKTLVGCFVF